MTNSGNTGGHVTAIDLVNRNLKKRYRAEKRFKLYGLLAIAIGMGSLLLLFTDIISKGHSAFFQHKIAIALHLDADYLEIDDGSDFQKIQSANFSGLIKRSLREQFPDVSGRRNKRELYALVSTGAEYELMDLLHEQPQLLGSQQIHWLLADDAVDSYMKNRDGKGQDFVGTLSEQQVAWIEQLMTEGAIKSNFNWAFFTSGDSREPELAGIGGGVIGSIFTLIVTLLMSFPIGVAAAIYLEEYATKNRLTHIIEVNINNLAAVPSIIFGLLGLAVFLNFFGMQRSAPLVGGIVLSLMTLPTIIISSRAAIKAVPPSIREAAMGIGASKMQVILHHILPLAMPGMLTGTIIGLAQALGETAPLLLIGMVAFIADIPNSFTDPASVLPVQIFLWADSPERAFTEKTSAAIMVLLLILISMNSLAVWLRRRLERRW